MAALPYGLLCSRLNVSDVAEKIQDFAESFVDWRAR